MNQAETVSVRGAEGHLVNTDDLPPVFVINPNARDCDVAAAATGLVYSLEKKVQAIVGMDGEDSVSIEFLSGLLDELHLARELLEKLTRRLEA